MKQIESSREVSPDPDAPEGFGSVAGVPGLPEGFAGTFASHFVDTGQIRLHAVIGGDGPPLLLVGGWPQSWYAWRLVMPALADRFRVVAVDPRGVGLSDKPADGYDTGTLAADLVAAMAKLGHDRFSMVGHDVGMWIGYALAADHPDRLDRLAVAEAAIPGVTELPPPFTPGPVNSKIWHFGFNRLDGINEELVRGREKIFFGHQFTTKAGHPEAVPDHAVDHYVETLARDPEALRASFEFYRAIDLTVEQNRRRAARAIEIPVLAIGGADGLGEAVAETMRRVATNVTSVVVLGGHYPAEEAPGELLAALQEFL